MFQCFYLRKVKSICILFVLIGWLSSFPIKTFASNGSISIKMKKQTIQRILDVLEKKSSYTFFYNTNEVNLNQKVSIEMENVTISKILKVIFKRSNYDFKVEGQQIIISKKKAFTSTPLQEDKKHRITGVIKDEEGNPVIGASVLEGENASNGTITDLDGQFKLETAATSLKISYIGFTSQIIKLKKNKLFYVITLHEDNKMLEEVVVVGYGTQKKVNLTGSVAAISQKDLKERTQPNLLNAIQGTIPGVTVISRPGGTTSINFRGRGNLGTSAPLYVIDGTIVDSSFFDSLNPSTIESISFLKDAASSAIYGSRAAYGVVLVTTKKGEVNKMRVNYNGYLSLNTPTYLPEVVNSWEYAEMLNEGIWNRDQTKGKFQAYTQEQIDLFKNGSQPDLYPNTRWSDLVLEKNSLTMKHTVDVSGGNKKVKYFANVGYQKTERAGFLPGKTKDRYDINLSVNSEIKKWLYINAKAKFMRNENKSTQGTPFLGFLNTIPGIMVAQQSNGEWGSMAGGQLAQQTFIQNNPLRRLAKKDWSNSTNDYYMYDLSLDFKPLKDLLIKGSVAYTSNEYKHKGYTALQEDVMNFQTNTAMNGTGTYTNSMSMTWTNKTRILYTATAQYLKKIQQHTLSSLLGTSYEDIKYQRLYASRKNFPIDGLEDLEAGSNASVDIANGAGSSRTKMMSYFGRINYNYADKYLFEANIRTDASSRFHKNKRWGVFPSFSGAWRISEEAFFKPINWVSNLKIRASWGKLGNINNVGNYDYFSIYSTNANYSFDDTEVKGVSESKPANLNLSWETVTLTDIGFDASFLKGSINLTVDYYIKNTNDILLAYRVPAETGIGSSPSQNMGKVENKGLEIAISHQQKIDDFSYSVSLNAAFNKNKIVDMGESNNKIYKGGDKIKYIYREGESIGSFYGYNSSHTLYTQEEIDAGKYYTFGRKPKAGDIKYIPQRDLKFGDAINGDDRVILGKDVPDFTYGINLSLAYKGFEISAFGQGVSGTSLALETDQVEPFVMGNNPKTAMKNRWTANNPNPHANFPRIYGGHSDDSYNTHFSDFNIFDADYFRLKSLVLGYRFSNNSLQSTPLSALKLFLSAENIFTIRADHRMNDFDPEETSGRGFGAIASKSFSFGINATF